MSDPADHSAGLLEVRYEFTPVLAEILSHLRASLMVTTYQAGKLLVLGTHQGELRISFVNRDQPMGLAIDGERMALGTRRHIHELSANRDVASSLAPAGTWDACFISRTAACTGSIHGHDLAWGREGLWIVNTLFSCLCTLHEEFSFVPRWKPPFITELADQDRCHLNGLAMDQGQPRFVTAMAETDVPGGWRPSKSSSGVVLDVGSGETIARGFAMPHSPRMYNGRLWVLDSGRGTLGVVDPPTGRFEVVETFPGYPRGLSFLGQFAFVGLSRIRETSVFGGVPIAERRQDLKCGVGVVDLLTGRTVAVFQFHSGVSEIFAVEVCSAAACPFVAGAVSGDREQDVWIVPPLGSVPRTAARIPWFAQQRPPDAERHSRQNPHDAAGWIALGNQHQDESREEEALLCYERALEADPRSLAARQNLGYLAFNQGFPERAVEICRELVQLDPSGMNRLLAASVLPIIPDSEAEIQEWRATQQQALQGLADEQVVVDASAQLVPTAFFWAYQGVNDVEIMRLRGRVIRGVDAVGRPHRTARRAADSGSRIRVGFLSSYFRDHTIGRLNIGRVEQLDRSRFHVTVCSAGRGTDELAERFRRTADHFVMLERDVRMARQQLLQLDLDVLLFTDVGMDALCSTLAFSRSAAVQCVTWGHPDTTGSPCMDAFLSSELLETDEADNHYTERLIRMPLLGTWYERPRCPSFAATAGTPLGSLPTNRPLYVCPQTLFKFHPAFDDILRGILRADAQGLLLLIEGRVPEWTRRLQNRWARTLADVRDRIIFLPTLPNEQYLQLLSLADVVLDPLHFGGGNSSYEALAMGTPIVTMPGEFLRGRITQALYRRMGLMDLVVSGKAACVDLAVRLASDREFRTGMHRRIAESSSILFENPEEVRCLEDTLASLL